MPLIQWLQNLGGAQSALACYSLSELDAVEAIYDRWRIHWTAAQPGVPYTFTNETSDGQDPAWARLSIQHSTSNQVTIGQAPHRKFERRGNVFVQLFGAVDVGRGALEGLVDATRTALESRVIASSCGAVYTRAARVVEIPEDGQWWMSAVVVPFFYQETR